MPEGAVDFDDIGMPLPINGEFLFFDETILSEVAGASEFLTYWNARPIEFGEVPIIDIEHVPFSRISYTPVEFLGREESEDVSTVPEPSSLVLLAIGLIGIWLFRLGPSSRLP